MKKEANKKSKLWIWIVIGIVALLAVAGVVLALVMGGGSDAGQEGPKGGRAELYWNVDKTLYTKNSESGLSTREPGEDGIFRVRYAYNGQLVELPIADKQLVNYIDTLDCMGIVQDADGVVIDVVDPKTLATETARMFYIRKVEGDTIVLNSSMAMNGMSMEIPVKEVTEVYDVVEGSATLGQKIDPAILESMDTVTVYSNDLGEATHIYVVSHPVESPVYWRADTGTYNSSLKETTRVPDEDGYYTIPFYVDGEYVELKCNIKGIVNTIDAKNRYKAHTGLVLDEDGNIVDNMLAATGIRGLLGCEMYDITAVDGTSFTAEALLAGSGDIYENTLSADAKIYNVSVTADENRGKAVDSLEIGDRVVVFENADGEAILVYIAQRKFEGPLYFNMTKKYNSTTKETKRIPEGGWYYIDLCADGKVSTYKTQDKAIVTFIDSQNNRGVALRVQGDVILAAYPGENVTGYGALVGYTVSSVTGSIISAYPTTGEENMKNMILSADCKVYNMSGVRQEKGAITTLQVGDYCIMWRNPRSEICYAFVIQRKVEAPIYFSLTRKWDSTKESTKREPDADGWYIYETICEGKPVTVKTKEKKVADFLDAQSPQTFALKIDKNGVILEYYETINVFGGAKSYLNHVVTGISGKQLKTYYSVTNKNYTPKLADNVIVYNFSQVYDKARGERTTIQVGDTIQCYTNAKGEVALCLVRNRMIDADIYFSKNRVKTVDDKGHTTRQPDAEGYYVFEVAHEGKEMTVKTKDIEVATFMDAQSPQSFALKLDKNNIVLKAYSTTAVTGGSTRALNAVVKSVADGKVIVRLSDGTDYEMPMASTYEVYNVSSVIEKNFGEKTTIKVGDTLQSYTDKENKVCLVFIRTRPDDTRMAWVLNQQYDKTNKVSLRTPDADGLFTVELAIDGKVNTYKVSGQKVINYIDSANGAVAVTFKNGIITNAQSAIYGPGIWTSTQAAIVATVQSVDGDTMVVLKSDGSTVQVTKAPEFVSYDVSGDAATFGAAATVKVNDSIRMYLNMDKQAMYCYIIKHNAGSSTPTAPTIKEYSNANLSFEPGTTKAQCVYCEKVVEWTALTAITATQDLTPGGHYYLAEDLSNTSYYNAVGGNSSGKATFCVHLNGHNITSTARAFAAQRYNILNIMGNGTVTGGNASNPVINSSATVNLIGGTYVANAGAKTVFNQQRAQEAVTVYKDVTITSAENTDGSAIYVTFGNLNVYGTVNGNIYQYGLSGTTKVGCTMVLQDAKVDGAVKIFDNGGTTTGVKIQGNTTISAKNGGLSLVSEDSVVKVTIGELGADAKLYVSGKGTLTTSFASALVYANSKILPAYDTQTVSVVDNAIVIAGEMPAPEEPAEPEYVWAMAWNVDPKFDDTNKVTTRTPDANGYYSIELSINGVTKTYKTKVTGLDNTGNGIDYADQSGAKNRPFVIRLLGEDSLEFDLALAATNNTGAKSAKVTTLTAVDGANVTCQDETVLKLAADAHIFNVSTSATVEGEIGTLAVGDYVRFYMDANGDILYAFIYTRTTDPVEPEPEPDPDPTPDPVPTWKMAYNATAMWDATNNCTTRTPDAEGYYYVDLVIDGVLKTYKTKATGLDTTGNGIDYADQSANKNRPFAVLLTDVDSLEFTEARSALYAPGCDKAGDSGVTFVEISGNTLTGTKSGETKTYTLTDNVETYNISTAVANFKGEATTLTAEDTFRVYLDEAGKVRYIYVTGRTAVVEPEPEPTPDPVPTWKMAWNVAPAWDDTNKVTTRTPDAEGYYYIDLSIDGEIKTYKTKTTGLDNTGNGIDYADQSGAKNRPFAVYLTDVNSVEFTSAKSAITGTGAKSAAAGTIVSIENGVITTESSAWTGSVAADAKIFDVSTKATVEGEISTLAVGDYVRFYLDADGKVLYAYLITRVAEPEEPVVTYTSNLVFEEGTTKAMCPVCNEVVTWEALTPAIESNTNLADGGHYYLAEDQLENVKRINLASGTACVHLNGHNITATENRAFANQSNTTLNIMGTGTVSGSATGSTAATMYSAGYLNLYAGTYTSFNSTSAVLSQQKANKGITIYKDANVIAPEGTLAINQVFGHVTIEGATVVGGIEVTSLSGSTKVTSKVVLNNATVTGQIVYLNAATGNDVEVLGAVVADVVLIDEVKLTVGRLVEGADIKVTATGAFTNTNENIQTYVDNGYISAKDMDKKIVVAEGVASIVDRYDNSDLVFEEGTTKAMCTFCGEVVEWIPVPVDQATTLDMQDNEHYYLVGDLLNVRVNTTSQVGCCFHLNGHNVINSTNRALSVQKDAKMNVMGNGVVSGASTSATTYASTISCQGSINLIGGTYKHETSTLPTLALFRATGIVNIYKDVVFTLEEGVTGSNILVNFGELNVYGATISGGVATDATGGKGANIAAMATVASAKTQINLYGATVDGGIYMANQTHTLISLNGAVKVSNKDGGITSDELITIGTLDAGAEVYVTAADGAFTVANDLAADYLAAGYIKAAVDGKTITESEGVLSIG